MRFDPLFHAEEFAHEYCKRYARHGLYQNGFCNPLALPFRRQLFGQPVSDREKCEKNSL